MARIQIGVVDPKAKDDAKNGIGGIDWEQSLIWGLVPVLVRGC